MALISCPDCEYMTSDLAANCKNCGCPIKGSVCLKKSHTENMFEFFSEEELKIISQKIVSNESEKFQWTKLPFENELPKEKGNFKNLMVFTLGVTAALIVFSLKI